VTTDEAAGPVTRRDGRRSLHGSSQMSADPGEDPWAEREIGNEPAAFYPWPKCISQPIPNSAAIKQPKT
jgi:hypothetical protein